MSQTPTIFASQKMLAARHRVSDLQDGLCSKLRARSPKTLAERLLASRIGMSVNWTANAVHSALSDADSGYDQQRSGYLHLTSNYDQSDHFGMRSARLAFRSYDSYRRQGAHYLTYQPLSLKPDSVIPALSYEQQTGVRLQIGVLAPIAVRVMPLTIQFDPEDSFVAASRALLISVRLVCDEDYEKLVCAELYKIIVALEIFDGFLDQHELFSLYASLLADQERDKKADGRELHKVSHAFELLGNFFRADVDLATAELDLLRANDALGLMGTPFLLRMGANDPTRVRNASRYFPLTTTSARVP